MEVLLARVFPGTRRSGARNSSYDLMSQKPVGKVFDAVIFCFAKVPKNPTSRRFLNDNCLRTPRRHLSRTGWPPIDFRNFSAAASLALNPKRLFRQVEARSG